MLSGSHLKQNFKPNLILKESIFMAFSTGPAAHSPILTAQFVEALSFAADKHRNQRRKDCAKTPYINHPIAIAHILLNEAGVSDETVLIAALLHDTVEDTDTSFEELEQRFGPVVRELVSEVTDDKSLPKAARKQAQIDHAPSLSDRARLIKLADKTANLRDVANAPPEGWSISRLDDYLDWGKTVIDGIRGSHAQLESLFDNAYQQGKNTVKALASQQDLKV
jgi:GTP diphosphokinase / guanosine-3',5'-bis(diphosphate) 3'-diphosphatase